LQGLAAAESFCLQTRFFSSERRRSDFLRGKTTLQREKSCFSLGEGLFLYYDSLARFDE